MKSLRIILLILLIAALGAGAYQLWRSQAVVVQLASVVRGQYVDTIEVEGVSTATNRTVLLALGNGQLEEIAFHAGDEVTAGQVLATIRPPAAPLLDSQSRQILEQKVSSTKQQWQTSDAEVSRLKKELDDVQKRRPVASTTPGQPRVTNPQLDGEEKALKRELTAAESNRDRLLAEWNVIRLQLGWRPLKNGNEQPSNDTTTAKPKEAAADAGESLQVIAPKAGHVLRVLRREAGPVASGSPLVEIGDLNELEYRFEMLTEDVATIKVGLQVHVRRSRGDHDFLMGTVRSISPVAIKRVSPLGAEELRTEVVVTASDEGGKLNSGKLTSGDGYRIHGEFRTQAIDDALKVSLGALYRQDEEWWLFRYDQGFARATKVNVLQHNHREAVIESGLGDHELVVMYPSARIKDGSRISVR